jgi:hypothetical protein
MANTLLYTHILSLLILMLNAGAVHLMEARLGSAQTTGEARRMLTTIVALGPVFGIGSLLLVVTGLSLAHAGDNDYSLGASWIVAAFIALVVINANGAGFLAPRAKRLAQTLEGESPLTAEQRHSLHDRTMAAGGWLNTGTAFGIVLLMVEKPAVAGCVAVLVIGAAAGVGIGLLQHSLTGRERAATA